MVCASKSVLSSRLLTDGFQSKTPEGYLSIVILKSKNPKTQELIALAPFKLPPTYKYLTVKPTALEARHFAATYGLFQVCSI